MTEEPEAVLSLFRLSMTEDEIAELAEEFDSAEVVGNHSGKSYNQETR